jgi:hypothetical protein
MQQWLRISSLVTHSLESKIKLENIDACMSNGGSFMTSSFSGGQVCVLLEESPIYNCLKMES